eukprot:m.1023443 g.1023443  ORF g.1023443 m.1023443 type:complete len:1316 (-) comp24097_c1_seq4:1404-5351(-)
MTEHTLVSGVFCKRGVVKDHNWRRRYFEVAASEDGGGKLAYYKVPDNCTWNDHVHLQKAKKDHKATLTISGHDAAKSGAQEPRYFENAKMPSAMGMPSGIWGNAKGDIIHRGVIHGDRQSYKVGGEDEDSRDLHFFCSSPNDVDIVVRLCNASDLTDKGVAAIALAEAFLHLTGNQSPMRYHSVKMTSATNDKHVINNVFPYSKEWPEGYTQYKMKPAHGSNVYIVFQDAFEPATIKNRSKLDVKPELPRWRMATKKEVVGRKEVGNIACCYQTHGVKYLEQVDGMWYLDGNIDPTTKMEFLGNLNVNLDAVLLTLMGTLKTTEALHHFIKASANSFIIERLTKRLSYRYPTAHSGFTARLLPLLQRFVEHAIADGTATNIRAVLCSQMIPHLLGLVADLESGQQIQATMVHIDGRAVDRHNSNINGWYTVIAPYNGRNAYYKRVVVTEGKKEVAHELFLWWNSEPSELKWCISAELGSPLMLAFNTDNVENAEAIAKTWMVRTASGDAVANEYNADDAVAVCTQSDHIFSYRHKLLDLVVELSRSHVACEIIAKNCYGNLVTLTKRAIVRLSGRQRTAHTPSTGSDDGGSLVVSHSDVVERVVRLLHTLSCARYQNPLDEKTCCFTKLFFSGTTSKPARILFLLLELFAAGTQREHLRPDGKDRGSVESPEILSTLPCDMYTLTLAASIPLSFRHLRDGRVAVLQQAIHSTLTPRLIAVAKELALTSESDTTLFCRYIEIDRMEHVFTMLGHACELKPSAILVASNPKCVRMILGILGGTVTTGMDRLSKVATITSGDGLLGGLGGLQRLASACREVLAIIVNVLRFVNDSKTISEGLFSADPVTVLLKVLEVGSEDMTNLLTAEAIYRLADHSEEHREIVTRQNGILPLLQLLKTGSSTSQRNAACALAVLLKNSAERQKMFVDAAGCLTLVRILERETLMTAAESRRTLLLKFVQKMVVHLTSIPASGRALAEAGVIPVLLKSLLLQRALPLDAQARITRSVFHLAFDPALFTQLLDANLLSAIENAMKMQGNPPVTLHQQFNDIDLVKRRCQLVLEHCAITDSDDGRVTELQDSVEEACKWIRIWARLQEQRVPPSTGSQVFVAYHPKNTEQAKELFEHLHAERFAMVPFGTGTCRTVSGLTKALDASAVVLLDWSTDFQDTVRCRGIVEYMTRVCKTLLPVVFEENFRPQGWLATAASSKRHFDVSRGLKKSALRDIVADVHSCIAGTFNDASGSMQASADAGGASHTTLPRGDLRDFLTHMGVLDEVGPILADNAIFTLRDLRGFTLAELTGLGIKAGYAKKLQLKITQ